MGLRVRFFEIEMSFWEDLSPAIKRYAIIGAVLLVGLIALRVCGDKVSDAGGKPAPRGLKTQ